MSPTYDVIVIGLGGMGSAAAHHLSARGARVLGLEKFGPVHNRGSSHGGSRITRQSSAEHLAGQLPSLPGTFLKAATCMYSNTPDEHFVIARHPAHPESVTVAAGFSGHGFKFVPVVGEIVADLALTGTTAHPIDLFDPSRLAAAPA
ncbi:FAD-dependent oxidoreductase [Streptomyces sp. NPDC056910]|uniref:FAD-dependent oxidoreductase n=1 Tax=Streptomyces sp. NPDC056910 TaxID=3345964 RepID=UPI0036A85573